jgi:hypothetical protein
MTDTRFGYASEVGSRPLIGCDRALGIRSFQISTAVFDPPGFVPQLGEFDPARVAECIRDIGHSRRRKREARHHHCHSHSPRHPGSLERLDARPTRAEQGFGDGHADLSCS